MAKVMNYQEETLLGMVTHEDMLRWSMNKHTRPWPRLNMLNKSKGSRRRGAWHQNSH
jgi:hypothetical protein